MLRNETIEFTLQGSKRPLKESMQKRKRGVGYVLTSHGERKFDLLNEQHTETPEGRAFRDRMTHRDWQMEQLLVLSSRTFLMSLEDYRVILNAGIQEMPIQLHRDLLKNLEILITQAVEEKLLYAH